MSEEQGHSADADPMEITLSANWIVGGGSLDNAFSFETTAEDTSATAASRGGLLLFRPPSLDSLPCEVTVSFREKHEIHQVYVKSTARTYEIYYASYQSNDNEYLCTVRCGAASEEVKFRTSGDETDIVQGDNSLLGQVPRCDSTVSTEDGWVEVKIPGTGQEDGVKSPPTVVDAKCNSTFQARCPYLNKCFYFLIVLSALTYVEILQMNYEATAEISDASPCISITIRFLSLQAKDSVHIEEIYIYADPIGSSCPDSSVSIGGSVGENSLLAMLVPSLMQLSKASPGSRSEDKRLDLKGQFAEEKAPATDSLDRHEPEHRGTFRSSGEEDMVTACKTKVASEDTKSTCSHHASDPDNMLKSILEENTRFYTRFETLLDKLVTRVERVEAYCSSFEENMMRPLNRIEMRLLQLEQRLTTFTGNFDCSKELPYLKISAPEFSSDESDVENDILRDARRNNAKDASFADISSSPAEMMCSMPGAQINPSLIVKEPAHKDDSSRNAHISINNTTFADLSSSPAKLTSSMVDAQIVPSLIIKAPEFSGEDEDNTDQPSESISNASVSVKAPEFYCEDEENVDETSDTMSNGSVRDKSSSSLSSALASALEALLSSTAIEALRSSHGPMNESFDYSATALTSSTTGITSAVFEKNITSEVDVEVLDNSCTHNSNDRASDDAKKATCYDSQSPVADTCGASLSESVTCQHDLCGTTGDKSLTILDDNVLVHHAEEGNIEVIHDRYMSPEQAVAGNLDMEQINFDTNGCGHIHDRLSPVADTCGASLSESETCQQDLCDTPEDKSLPILDDNVLVHHAKEGNIEVIHDRHTSPEQAVAGNSDMEQINFDTNACGHICGVAINDEAFSHIIQRKAGENINENKNEKQHDDRSSLSNGAIADRVMNPDIVTENTGNSYPVASNTYPEQRKDVTLDLEQSILDVQFAKERDSTTKDLLEALLGEVSFLEELVTASVTDLGKSSNGCSEDPFCDVAVTVEASSSEESHLQVSGSSDHLTTFSSLI